MVARILTRKQHIVCVFFLQKNKGMQFEITKTKPGARAWA
jgi:hypothetical protein